MFYSCGNIHAELGNQSGYGDTRHSITSYLPHQLQHDQFGYDEKSGMSVHAHIQKDADGVSDHSIVGVPLGEYNVSIDLPDLG